MQPLNNYRRPWQYRIHDAQAAAGANPHSPTIVIGDFLELNRPDWKNPEARHGTVIGCDKATGSYTLAYGKKDVDPWQASGCSSLPITAAIITKVWRKIEGRWVDITASIPAVSGLN